MDQGSIPAEDARQTTLDLIDEIHRPLEAVANFVYLARKADKTSEMCDTFLQRAEEEIGKISAAVVRFQSASVRSDARS